MRTFESNGVTFIHNGDFSGGVRIECNELFVNVPFEALKDFVADDFRRELIAFAENAPTDDILNHATTRIVPRG